MTWLRRWLLGDLLERVETLENWCRHHDMPRVKPLSSLDTLARRDLAAALREEFARIALGQADGPGN